MRRFVQHITLGIILLLSSLVSFAQVTPVQVSPQLVPPYSLQVSEYYSGTIPKIQVLLINRDINQPTIQVKLKMTVESQNCRLRTKEVNTIPAITLTNGVPYYLAPSELQALFSSANLDFGGGLSEQQYNQTLRFPEGLYTFTFEAYELYSGNLVSNKGFSMGWLTLADPPLLNTPSKGEEVTPNSTQSIVFNWTPRHNTSPTAAYYTDYLFTLVEYNDAALSPEAAFVSSNPILQKTVTATTLLFSNQEAITTNLIEGKRYAWRVQAKAKSNATAQEIAMFRNNGISEVHWFVYKNSCTAPQGITVNVQGQRATIEWQNNPLHLEWKVEYREHRAINQQQAEWFTISNTLPRVVIMDLKPSTNYEYRVGGACYVNQFTYSPLAFFSTANAPVPPVVNCGDSSYPVLGTAGLQTLNAGDTIRAGSFTVKVGYSTGSGSFTGTGYVIVPWLMNAKVEVKFTNITMSTDYKLVSGLIETTYDPTESGIDDIDEYVDIFKAGFGVGDVVTGEVTADKTVDFIVQWPNGVNVTLPPNYDNQTGQGSGPITIALTPKGGGAATTYTVDQLPTTIKDKDGNLYQVDKAGNISQIGKAGGGELLKQLNTKVIDKDKAEVKFVDYPTRQVYAFDEWKEVYKKSSTFSKEYERIGDYYVSQKAIAPGQTDYLKAVVTVTDTSVNPRNIEFVNGKGTIYSKKALDSTYKVYEIAIVGGPEKDAQEIYAVYKPSSTKTLNLGKVKVSSYPKREYKVKLVPVNGATINIDSVTNGFISAYRGINVDFIVEVDSMFTDNTWDLDSNGLTVTGSGNFALLTEEMKSINNAYRNKRVVDKQTTYLFVISNANEAGIKGDMPRGKQFGYIFVNGNTTLGRTSAHEIAHGKFKLKHIEEYSGFSETDLSNNLLSKGSEVKLSKFQWDLLHDPAILLFNFDSDENAMDKESFEKLEDLLKAIKERPTSTLEYDISPLYWGIKGGAHGTFDLNKDGRGVKVYLKFPTFYVAPTTNGVINFSVNDNNGFLGIGFFVNLNNSLHNEFDLNFFKSGTSDLAFKLTTYDYESCKELLEYLGLSISSTSKTNIINQYKTALMSAGNDCNKLDVLFESIPDFVINSADPSFNDASLWQYLKSLANCTMGTAGTDDEKAALNLIKGFKNKEVLYNYLKNDNKTTMELYKGIDGDNCYQFLNCIADLCDLYGDAPLPNYFAFIGTVPNGKYTGSDEICNGKNYLTTVGSQNFTSVNVGCNIGEITGMGTGTHIFKNINSFFVPSFLNRIVVYKNEEAIQDTLPALYLGHLAEKQGQSEILTSINNASMVLGLTGAVRVLFTKGAGYLAKAIAFTEITKLSIDGFMSSEENRKVVASWGTEGQWIVENWNTISITTDLTTLGSQFLISFARSGAVISNKLRVRGEAQIADELDEMVKAAAAIKGSSEIFDIASFKSLTNRIPSGNQLTKLKRVEFIENGYRVKPQTGSLKNKVDDIVEYGDNGSNGIKAGKRTEDIVDEVMVENGYQRLDGHYGSDNGYDGVYIKGTMENPTEIIIVESKQFKYTNGAADDIIEHNGVTLNPPSQTTPLPAQMSDAWIQYVAGKLNDVGKTNIAEMILDNPALIKKYVCAVDKSQAEINFLKLGNY